MIPQEEGRLLRQVLSSRELYGYLVPINCAAHSNKIRDLCAPVTVQERILVNTSTHGGIVYTSSELDKVEFLIAHFGVPPPLQSVALEVIEPKGMLVYGVEMTI
jgi:hypothetical protein